jgi:feruloyl-CoA synthase
MWCANQQQMAQSMPVLTEAPPGAGGLAALEPHLRRQPQLRHGAGHGGTLYIDDGKPTPALIRDPAQPARDRAHGVLQRAHRLRGHCQAMKTDDALRRNLLSRVRMFFYAGAALAQPVWDSLYESRSARSASAS